ncbi:PepSY domain-containing protein [Streptomyces sp. NPDC059740]|uniref:PepSY domain-containing protein n=1 Tax=Streptomyces sp. NPDC059740 TaxID=3346926 RepID=UPI003654CD9A
MKRSVIVATATAAVLVAGGTATALAVNAPGSQGTAPAASRDAQAAGGATAKGAGDGDVREAREAKVTPAQAQAAAHHARSGLVTGLDLDRDRPGLVWDVDIAGHGSTSHEIVVDAHTGRVLADHTDRDDDDAAEARTRLHGTSVNAVEAARAAHKWGAVTSVDVDDDQPAGKALWKVETVTGKGVQHDVLVDAHSGHVTRVTVDDAEDED